mmetsp:Transcript_33318/g.61957  ORF Transcript_33318/g.61957 Transcript_33318/m.61957 type:complete len:89 (-) Transcript_33318:83-349(-)
MRFVNDRDSSITISSDAGERRTYNAGNEQNVRTKNWMIAETDTIGNMVTGNEHACTCPAFHMSFESCKANGCQDRPAENAPFFDENNC